jgi:hypothetical protein
MNRVLGPNLSDIFITSFDRSRSFRNLRIQFVKMNCCFDRSTVRGLSRTGKCVGMVERPERLSDCRQGGPQRVRESAKQHARMEYLIGPMNREMQKSDV